MLSRPTAIFTALLFSLILTHAQELPLTSELRKEISEWRMSSLPTLPPERYWVDLKNLGSKVGEAHAKHIEASGVNDPDSAIALMAYRVWRDDGKVAELNNWYGRRVDEISPETWEQMRTRLSHKGLSRLEIYKELANSWSFGDRAAPPVMRLIVSQHKQVEFLPAWEAWMLSPYSRERENVRERMNEALSAIGNERTIALLAEKCRILPEHNSSRPVEAERRQKLIQAEADEIRRIIRSIGGKAAVLGLLECVRIAEAKGYPGEGHDSIRNLVIYLLTSSYNPRELKATPEWEESLRVPGMTPGKPGSLRPWDDKWKEFKPIIDAMLRDPKNLSAEDIVLLKEALAAMPKK